ncbi:hypothetical protein Tsubulata_028115 [Turnera subulata]|uniref:Fatty acyl-CoA reductase n=1 Tax=Turnera subulata TaxID=218843 RepID=A0A9Q0J567_9ROSI|nr:hypothetical protein Tsubulata_028115 [Turnera subulata]
MFWVQPNVKKMYLLLRAADAKSASQRLQTEIIGKDLFRLLREKWGSNLSSFISEKVVLVPGDISLDEDLGVKDHNLREEMWSQLDVVINLAATTNFDESGEKSGLILETPYTFKDTLNGVSGLSIDEEKHVIEQKLNQLKAEGATDEETKVAMKDLGIKRTIDSLAVAYAKGRLTCFLGDLNGIVDLIPADMVVNAMLVAMVAHANQQQSDQAIYQVGSSVRNPMRNGDLQEYGFAYFSAKPWIGKDGKPVIVKKVKVLGSMPSFHKYMALRYMLPLQGLAFANSAFCNYFDGVYSDLKRKVNLVMRLVELYRPYLFFRGVFDDMNTEKLRMVAEENIGVETHLFYFNPETINWENYFLNNGCVTRFLENRNILVTGATGFLAKIFLEKILRVQPDVKKIYLLLRAVDAKSASQRFQSEIIGKDLFRLLREKLGPNFDSFISEKVVVVPGDISLDEDLGIQDPNLRQDIWSELDVIVHSAATTAFDERYDVALGVNTTGAKHTPYTVKDTINGVPGLDIDEEKNIVEDKLNELKGRGATDMVVNAMLVAMVANDNQSTSAIYQVGSSLRNPIRIGEIRDYSFAYFREKPWIGKNGKPIKVCQYVKELRDISSFRRYITFHYMFLLQGLAFINLASCNYFNSIYCDRKRRLKFLMRLMELNMPYTFFRGIFDDTNTEELRMGGAQEKGVDQTHLFHFDPKTINWEDYFLNAHIPGLIKYFGDVIPFLEKKNILVTGATGFLAKIFVEKILRVQPNIQKIYLLLRAADGNSASQRFQNEIVGKDLFRVLKEKWGSNFNSFITDKTVLVPGDISLGEDLGVKEPKLRDEMWSQLDVIVNLAATTNFDERTIDSVAVAYAKGRLPFFLCDLNGVVDVIPADMVVNAMLVAMVAHANHQQQSDQAIYHVGSSVRNPVNYGDLQEYGFDYFSMKPWIGKDGKPVLVGKVKGLALANSALCHYFDGVYTDLKRKINFVFRLVELYRPYVFFRGVFDDMNTERLRMAAKENGIETHLFYFDPETINWRDYFLNKLRMAGAQEKNDEETHLFYFDPMAINWADYYLKFGDVIPFLEKKNILVTGATGFLAKIFVEKILRVQPKIQKIYLLLRAADDKSASQRLQNEIIEKDLFRVLKEKWGSNFNSFITQKIVLVPGDISLGEDLGVKEPKSRDEMWSQLDVIVNLSATTNFDERYDIALITNTFGAKHVVCFAKKCIKLQLLVHKAGLIPETPYTFKDTISGVSGLDIDEEKHIVQKKLSELRIEEATDKAITEAMKDLGMKRTIDGFILTYAKGRLPFFLADPNTVVDLIPADMVVNAMLVAMVAHANQPSLTIYQIGTSKKNPITYGDFRDYKVSYFKRKPWIGKDGQPVKVGRIKILGSVTSFHIYVAFHYLLPLQGLKFANSACGNYFDRKYWHLKQKVDSMMRLMELFRPYLFFKGIFDDTNTEKLQMAFNENKGETHLFYFDPNVIDWKDYFFNVHIPGVVKVFTNRRTVDGFTLGYAKGRPKFFFANAKGALDVIPADMVVNGMLVAMAAHATQPSLSIYHIGSSKRNPITYSEFRDYNFTYFKRRPWIGRNGEPVKVGRRMKIFDDQNIEKLQLAAQKNSEEETHLFYFDPQAIDWEDYFLNAHFPGVKLWMAFQEKNDEEAHLFNFDPEAINWEDYYSNAHIPGLFNLLVCFSVAMEFGSVIPFLEDKNILVTGATGFLAKIFVEKILRVQPNIQKIYLLLRAADDKSASQRLQNEIIGKDLFRVLKEEWGSNFNSFISQKIMLVPGDISLGEDLGVKEPKLRQEMWSQLDVIVNLAATTNFDERYDAALSTNTFGAKNVVCFAKKCIRLQLLVHKAGLIREAPCILQDTLTGVSGLDIDEEKHIVEQKISDLKTEGATDKSIVDAMKDLGIERTIDSVAVAYAKGRLTIFLCDLNGIVDVIPADMVVNAMLVAMVAHANQQQSDQAIYHMGSSVRNPVNFGELHQYAFDYFSMKPWIGKDGKPVMVSKVKVLDNMSSFNRYMVRYMLLLQGLALANSAFCHYFDGVYTDLKRKINFVFRLVELYRPYMFFRGVFDDMNTVRLRMAAKENGVETHLFYFDPETIKWRDYFLNVHIPGLIKYVCK